MKHTLKIQGHETTKDLKKDIQALVREIVIKRDGGCILRKIRHCGGEIGQSVLQADHLITRANSATYADTRLIVCLCRPCHGGYKQWHKEVYDDLVRSILSKERVKLWDKCQKESWKPQKMDWRLEKLALIRELKKL